MTTLPDSTAWKNLAEHQRRTAAVSLGQRFEQQPERAVTLSATAGPLNINYSRQRLDAQTLDLLFALAQQREVPAKLAAVMRGDMMNPSEQRSACHNQLRATKPCDAIASMRATMQELVAGVHDGSVRGATGQRFRQIVNIGIGGSDLGPRLMIDTLDGLVPQKLECHFLANIDPTAIAKIFQHCSPDESLFLVSSKFFGTEETLSNAKAAMAWVRAAVGEGFEQHFVAITCQAEKAASLGITRSVTFPEWVGGRFSIWSAIALPFALTYGMASYTELLRGGESIDTHTEQESRPLPVLSGLIDVWNRNFLNCNALAVLPYAERLRLLPDYLQQLFMESQGKQTTDGGELSACATGMVLFGSQGSNGQHSFLQLLHQGSEALPCDLLLPLHNADARTDTQADQHQRLIANCLGQSLALAKGQSTADITARLRESGMAESEANLLARHKTIPGNRPHSLISFEQVDAYTLGALIAYYEYRMMTACFIWGINPFDQWGVELGKVSSRAIL
ncbi:MAG: glucose-6-phosphate isomerase, partial [Bacteroidia bacterium]